MLEQLDILIGFITVITVASLVVTVLTQLICGLLALRGAHLRNGLVEVVKATVAVDNNQEPEQLVTAILTHPLLTDKPANFWNPIAWGKRGRLASAVRFPEFFAGLQRVGFGSREVLAAGVALLEALSENKDLSPETRTALAKAAANRQEVIASGQQALTQMVGTLLAEKVRLEEAFNTSMERIQERFAASTRKSNFIFGMLIAFVLQLDTFELFRRISTDSNLRAQLVKASGTVLKEGDDILQRATETPAHRQPAILAQLKKMGENAGQGAWSPEDATAFRALLEDPTFVKQLEEPPPSRALKTNGDWDVWVREQAEPKFQAAGKTTDESRRRTDLFIAAYGEARATVTRAMLETLRGDLSRSSDLLAGTGLQLVPEKYPASIAAWLASPKHCGGMIMTGLLLSLGAPYWFNVLKTLSSLRPALAENVQQSPDKAVAA